MCQRVNSVELLLFDQFQNQSSNTLKKSAERILLLIIFHSTLTTIDRGTYLCSFYWPEVGSLFTSFSPALTSGKLELEMSRPLAQCVSLSLPPFSRDQYFRNSVTFFPLLGVEIHAGTLLHAKFEAVVWQSCLEILALVGIAVAVMKKENRKNIT